MRSQVYFYSFDSKRKPGVVLAHGIRFETVELKNDATFDQTSFKILCPQHDELKAVPLAQFAGCVADNFPPGKGKGK